MPAHAATLSMRHSASDRRDAHNMGCYARLRPTVSARGRMLLLSGLAGNVAGAMP